MVLDAVSVAMLVFAGVVGLSFSLYTLLCFRKNNEGEVQYVAGVLSSFVSAAIWFGYGFIWAAAASQDYFLGYSYLWSGLAIIYLLPLPLAFIAFYVSDTAKAKRDQARIDKVTQLR